MQLIPVKTRVFYPPQDDLYEILDESLSDVQERDIVLVTSKVVAIHQGRCVSMANVDKEELVKAEADYIFNPAEHKHPLTIKYNALISSAGIDESNGSGYYILLPAKPFETAREIQKYLKNRFGLKQLGVIITDSHSLPFRYGAMSVSIGYFGFEPVTSHIGRSDLFGRVMKYSSTNIVDSLASASALVSGECDEAQPVVIARSVPNIVFSEEDLRDKLLVPRAEDIYRDLYKDFKKSN